MLGGINMDHYVRAILRAFDSKAVEPLLSELMEKVPIELQTFILEQIMSTELSEPWNQEELKGKLNKLFLAYLPAQIEDKDRQGIITRYDLLTREQREYYLKALDYKVTNIRKKAWDISPTVLIKFFYEGKYKNNIIKIINDKKLTNKQKNQRLTTRYGKTIEQLEETVLAYRHSIKYMSALGMIDKINSQQPHFFIAKKIKSLEGLEEIPEIKDIHALNFSKNELTSIKPGVFDKFDKLTDLDLSNNRFTSLAPKTFDGLNHLKTLALSHNKLTTLAPGTFEKLVNLRFLSLSFCTLISLNPGTFRGLDKLRFLELNDNKLDDSLDIIVFKDLPALTSLNLRDNAFSPAKKEAIKNNLSKVCPKIKNIDL